MTILNLSREECSHRLETPYNPPAPPISDQDFEEEYYLLFSKLEDFMTSHGENNAYGASCKTLNLPRFAMVG